MTISRQPYSIVECSPNVQRRYGTRNGASVIHTKLVGLVVICSRVIANLSEDFRAVSFVDTQSSRSTVVRVCTGMFFAMSRRYTRSVFPRRVHLVIIITNAFRRRPCKIFFFFDSFNKREKIYKLFMHNNLLTLNKERCSKYAVSIVKPR